MPVKRLFCEGGNRSPDVRVLAKLLAGLCTIKPDGGKYGMGNRIKAMREARESDDVAGILDGDFRKNWQPPEGRPKVWEVDGGQTVLGWRWERKEIENYLIDPVIVGRAIGLPADDLRDYTRALEKARDRIAIYQAARTALSANRVERFQDLPSGFGLERGKDKHPFPDRLDDDSCQSGIKETVGNHQASQSIRENDVLSSYQKYLDECQAGGPRHQHYLYAFAGKDLFWSLDGWLRGRGRGGAWVFREQILIGIRNTSDRIATWIPEWRALSDLIQGPRPA